MKGLDLTNMYNYKVVVKFNKECFDDPNYPRTHELNFYSTSPKDKKHIQKTYQNGIVLDVELVSEPITKKI
ncbi:MAG: hypothetical protein KatS3mg035_1067 [Bacteroidia bacterium]|nr:MAG: hypothetical protein KatS3mg035_1067 [Bacteroidia bacterium]